MAPSESTRTESTRTESTRTESTRTESTASESSAAVGERVLSPAATTRQAGRAVDEGRGRVFPCSGCGADLRFHIGQQRMKCPFCGHEEEIALPEDAQIVERDYEEMLRQLRVHHDQGRDDSQGLKELRCNSCGGVVIFEGTLTSRSCPYCASPIQIDQAEQAKRRIATDAVLPFLVDHDRAARNLADWVRSRWFAPNEFLEKGVKADFQGVYLPFWTFDSMTAVRYRGQRGDYYTVRVGVGKDARSERRTRWSPASGAFERFFDDVLVDGSTGLDRELVLALEPWPLHKAVPYNQSMLAGFLARAYEVELAAAFDTAKKRIETVIEADVRHRIGGDTQQVEAITSRHAAVTFKLLLLPVWMMAYRYGGSAHQVLVNAATGEVQGARPYSAAKITLAVIAGLIAVMILYFFLAASQR